MTLKQFIYGFWGAFIGSILAAPLAVHEGWASLLHYRDAHDTGPWTYFYSSLFILPILMFLGLLGTPFIAAYAAYRCGIQESLSPIADTFKHPYQAHEALSDMEMNVSRGILAGYSFTLTLLSFALINVLTGNFLGALGLMGSALFTGFGLTATTVSGATLGTLFIPYIGGLVGGSIGCGTTYYQRAYPDQSPLPLPPEQRNQTVSNADNENDDDLYTIMPPQEGIEMAPLRAISPPQDAPVEQSASNVSHYSNLVLSGFSNAFSSIKSYLPQRGQPTADPSMQSLLHEEIKSDRDSFSSENEVFFESPQVLQTPVIQNTIK